MNALLVLVVLLYNWRCAQASKITVKKDLTAPKAKTELRVQYLKDLNRLRFNTDHYLDESGFKSHEHSLKVIQNRELLVMDI
jgi:hypothetical protein